MPFHDPVRELSKQCIKFDLEVIDDVADQVKVEMFSSSGSMRLASKISMINANKANESTWIKFLTFISRYHYQCPVTRIPTHSLRLSHQVSDH